VPRVKNEGLVAIHLRLRRADVEKAKREAAELEIPYTHVLRKWVAERAELARRGSRG
jgi:hypothetical protein